MDQRIIVTIDGPAGSGKTTLAKMLAKRLNIAYLDTGAMYRGVALFFLDEDEIEEQRLKDVLENISFDLVFDGEEFLLALNNKILGQEIRSEKVGFLASTISKIPIVREYLTTMQREIAKKHSIVAEGRDMGTVVFPEAQYKFFLTANLETRAKRRWLQLKEMGSEADLNEILSQIKKRDEQDKTRDIAPLYPAPDAKIIDTSNLRVNDVLKIMLDMIEDGK